MASKKAPADAATEAAKATVPVVTSNQPLPPPARQGDQRSNIDIIAEGLEKEEQQRG